MLLAPRHIHGSVGEDSQLPTSANRPRPHYILKQPVRHRSHALPRALRRDAFLIATSPDAILANMKPAGAYLLFFVALLVFRGQGLTQDTSARRFQNNMADS